MEHIKGHVPHFFWPSCISLLNLVIIKRHEVYHIIYNIECCLVISILVNYLVVLFTILKYCYASLFFPLLMSFPFCPTFPQITLFTFSPFLLKTHSLPQNLCISSLYLLFMPIFSFYLPALISFLLNVSSPFFSSSSSPFSIPSFPPSFSPFKLYSLL